MATSFPSRKQADGLHAEAPPRARYDADLAESHLQCGLLDQIIETMERTAALVDEEVNVTEASEARHAAYETQSMR